MKTQLFKLGTLLLLFAMGCQGIGDISLSNSKEDFAPIYDQVDLKTIDAMVAGYSMSLLSEWPMLTVREFDGESVYMVPGFAAKEIPGLGILPYSISWQLRPQAILLIEGVTLTQNTKLDDLSPVYPNSIEKRILVQELDEADLVKRNVERVLLFDEDRNGFVELEFSENTLVSAKINYGN